jgi:hypothetical protein
MELRISSTRCGVVIERILGLRGLERWFRGRDAEIGKGDARESRTAALKEKAVEEKVLKKKGWKEKAIEEKVLKKGLKEKWPQGKPTRNPVVALSCLLYCMQIFALTAQIVQVCLEQARQPTSTINSNALKRAEVSSAEGG